MGYEHTLKQSKSLWKISKEVPAKFKMHATHYKVDFVHWIMLDYLAHDKNFALVWFG